jgi:hypothetical protein
MCPIGTLYQEVDQVGSVFGGASDDLRRNAMHVDVPLPGGKKNKKKKEKKGKSK